MKKIIMKTFAACVMLTMLFTGCSKDGATGPAGPTGPAGTNGTNGVSNITAYTATTTNTSWTLNGTEYDATINVAGINSAVVSNGTIMVFLGNTAQTNWSALPFSYQGVEFNYTYSTGQVMVQVTLSNAGTPNNPGG